MSNDQGTEVIEPITEKPHPIGKGVQRLYRFDNGYGASVVCGPYSYGGSAGLQELAVLRYDGDDYELTYDTPITDDVIGHLTEDEVQEHLRAIRALPAVTE